MNSANFETKIPFLILGGILTFGAFSNSLAADNKFETRTYSSSSCILGPEEPPAAASKIFEVFVAPLVGFAIDGVANAFLEASKEKTVTQSHDGNFYLYSSDLTFVRLRQNPNFRCLTTVTAKFKDSVHSDNLPFIRNVNRSTKVDFSLSQEEVSQSVLKRLTQNGIELNGEPALVYEVKLESSLDSAAFRLVSQVLLVNELVTGARKKSRGLIYSYEVAGPGATPGGQSYALAVMNFGAIKAPVLISGDEFYEKKPKAASTNWLTYIGVPDNSVATFKAAKENGAKVPTLYAPATLITRVSEVQAANKVGLFIAKLLGAAKPELVKSTTAAILPSSRQAAGDADAAKLAAAEKALRLAEIAYLTAIRECEKVNCEVSDSAAGRLAKATLDHTKVELDLAKAALRKLKGTAAQAPNDDERSEAKVPNVPKENFARPIAKQSISAADRFEIDGNELIIDDKAFALMHAKWQTKTIFSCWENATVANASGRNIVEAAVRSSWEQHSALSFHFSESCPNGFAGIRINIDDSGPHVKNLGRYLAGMPSGMVLNFTFTRWGHGCQPITNECIKSIAVHEYGHALGLAHEQNRPDTPGACLERPQGTDGDTILTPWDPSSVMNYCNPDYNNFGVLSRLDVVGIQKMYGAPE